MPKKEHSKLSKSRSKQKTASSAKRSIKALARTDKLQESGKLAASKAEAVKTEAASRTDGSKTTASKTAEHKSAAFKSEEHKAADRKAVESKADIVTKPDAKQELKDERLAAGDSRREHEVDAVYAQLHQACARSTNMRGRLRKHQAAVSVELPDALPGALLLRALQKSDKRYQTLSVERLTGHEQQHGELQLNVAGLSAQQLQSFIAELDELIGEFTGRS